MKLRLKSRSSRSPCRSPSRDSSRTEIVDIDPPAFLVKELSGAFKVFDKDGVGKISKIELGTVLRSLGDNLSDAELEEVIQRVDGDGDGYIDLQEFIRFHTERSFTKDESTRTTSTSSEESNVSISDDTDDLLAAFNVFDVDKNGFISADELQRVMWSLDEKHTSLAECRHMINCVDKDGDHMVNFEEFQWLMSGTSVSSQEFMRLDKPPF